jgi:hypothetical protein
VKNPAQSADFSFLNRVPIAIANDESIYLKLTLLSIKQNSFHYSRFHKISRKFIMKAVGLIITITKNINNVPENNREK